MIEAAMSSIPLWGLIVSIIVGVALVGTFVIPGVLDRNWVMVIVGLPAGVAGFILSYIVIGIIIYQIGLT